MTDRYDAVVVGAGHNGLVCAALLARSGRSVLVLEANEEPGGVAVSREFAQGYRASVCAQYLYQLQPAVRAELGLRIRLAADDLATIVLSAEGRPVRYRGGAAEGVGETDRDGYRAFHEQMCRFAGFLAGHFNESPPRPGSGERRDALGLLGLAVGLRRLGRADLREFLRLIASNVRDELVDRFESPALRGGLAADAILGTHLGPRSPTSLFTGLHRLAGNGGRIALPEGGMTAVAAALADAARDAGAVLATGRRVGGIVVEHGRAVGVRTEDGARYDAAAIVSNADPRRTVLELVGARHFEAPFVSRIRHLRARGNAARLHLALDALPSAAGLEPADLGQRLLIAPDEDYVENAFNPAKYGEFSRHPVIELAVPSVPDPSLAPPGRHVLSATVQYAPYDLAGGWDDAAREAFLTRIMTTLERFLPGLGGLVRHSELLLPLDLEREFHLTGGHWHHAELALDQFACLRPVPGAARYRLPLDGLYLCGAGAHPGGGVSGAPGRNAARAIIAEGRR